MSTTRKTKTAPTTERKAAVKTVKKKTASAAKPKAGVKAKGGGQAAAPGDEQIAALAYKLWEQAGRPEGRSDEHWREAEVLLRQAAGGD